MPAAYPDVFVAEDRTGRHRPNGRSAGLGTPIQNVGIDLRRGYVARSEQFLHGADVVAVFERMPGERVPQRVRGARLALRARHVASLTVRCRTDSGR